MIKIPKDIICAIRDQAEIEAPLEACGCLAGKDSEIKEIYKMTNVDKSPEHFSLSPQEQFKVIKEARKKGIKLLAVYHSHPATAARLSKEDIKLAVDPDMVYIIYSLLDNTIKGFKVLAGGIAEEMIEEML